MHVFVFICACICGHVCVECMYECVCMDMIVCTYVWVCVYHSIDSIGPEPEGRQE